MNAHLPPRPPAAALAGSALLLTLAAPPLAARGSVPREVGASVPSDEEHTGRTTAAAAVPRGGGPDGLSAAALDPGDGVPAAATYAGDGVHATGTDTAARVPGPATPPPPDTLGAWNSERVLELVRSAVRARRHGWSDSTLHAFRARAQAHVYFLGGVGRAAGDAAGAPDGVPGADAGRLLRADQVALRIRWHRGRAVQTIVGRRSEKRFPTSIRYHIDHLSLVLENFGDRISLGEGTEVRNVVHPLAPGAPDVYEYRLADSLGLGIGGERRTLYRVEVRPRDPSRPAVVGELHLDADSRAVARMRFTFTPAAYRDDDLASIEVELESALWEGRWWLPAVQEVTVRRRVRWLDFPLTGVIRTRLRVHDYEINPEPPPRLAPGHEVTRVSEEELAAFDAWRSGLYDGPIAAREAADPLDPGRVRRRARELMTGRYLGGSAALAPSLAGVSDVLRARRAEGGLGGMGLRWRTDDTRTLSLWGGRPFDGGRTEWRAAFRGPLGPVDLELRAYGDRLSDVGPVDAASGVTSSLGFLLRGEDFTDPYFRDGASATVRAPALGGTARARVAFERHEAAGPAAEPPGQDPPRPVRGVAEGELGSLAVGWRASLGGPLAGSAALDLEAEGATSAVGDFGYTRLLARLAGAASPAAAPWDWRLAVGLGVAGGDLPPQRLYLLGGRGTVPGYGFRRWAGDRAAWVRMEAAREAPGVGPWVRIRAVAAAGWTDLGGPGAGAAAAWREAAVAAADETRASGGGDEGPDLTAAAFRRHLPVAETGGVRPSVGVGLGFVDGTIRLDAVRGLDGGRWEWIVSVDPRWWGVL